MTPELDGFDAMHPPIGDEPMRTVDAADLLALQLPPLRSIVPDWLVEGTTVLAAPPKIGKSCLVYQLAVEVAIGGELFGRRVTPGSVLYLALEDGKRRGRDRLRLALGERTLPRGRLEVAWSAPPIGDGLEEMIGEWLNSHPDAALVAIDTLGRVRPRTNGRRNAYEVDVEDLGRLQALFRDRQLALVIVHHSRKEAGDDFLASVSGTYGITGSADTIAVIRRKRLEAFGTIVVTGRDVADAELSVRFDGLWHEAPPALPEASFERAEVYRIIEQSGPIFPAAIAEQLNLSRTSVQNMVGKLVERGAVARTTKGYEAVEPSLISPDDSSDSDSHHSHQGHDGPSADISEADFQTVLRMTGGQEVFQ
jgi:biotin operon repressor